MTERGALHLDLDQLADALAGEGDADSAAHRATCPSCTSRLAELEAAEGGVLAALRTLPDPVLPAGLADRLSAAFAAEPAPASAAGTVTALPARAPRRRLLPAAAAAVLALSAGGLGYAVVSGSGGGADTASSNSAAGGVAAGPPTSASGADYADAAAVTGVLPDVLAGSAAAEQDAVAGATAPETARSATELRDAAATAADPLGRLRTPEGLQDCLSAVLPPEEPDLQPRALDYARYQGRPALAVLLPDPDPAKVSVYVVGPQCAAADATLLGFFRVDAP